MDPAIVGSDQFAQLFKTALPGNYIGSPEQIFSQPLVYTPAGGDGTQYVYFATTQNNVYKLDAKTGEIVASRNLHIPFMTDDLDGCVDINPLVGITSTGVIDPDTDTLYLTAKTYQDQTQIGVAQGKPNGRYYIHALDTNNLSERENFPVNLEGIAARNNPVRTFNGGIHHQRPALLHSGQYVYGGFASHCVQYNFTGWVIGWDKTTGALVEHWATEGEGVPNTTPGGGVWMSGGGIASDNAGSLFCATGNGYASQLADVPVNGRDPPTSLEEAALHMTINDDGSLTLVDFFMPYEKQALDGADKDLGTSPLEILPSEFSCGEVARMGVVTGKSGKTYWLNLDDLGGYKKGADGEDNVIQVWQNENSVYAGAGVYPLEGGYIYINVIQYPTHVFKFSCDNGVPSFTKVADSPTNNAYILGVGHGTVTSLNGQAGTGLVWTSDVQGENLRIYKAIPENGLMTLIKSFTVTGTTKFTRPVFGDGIVYMGTTLGYVYAFGAPTNPPLNCTTPYNFGDTELGVASAAATIKCTAKIGLTVAGVNINSTEFSINNLPSLPLDLAVGGTFTLSGYFEPDSVGFTSGSVSVDTTNSETGYSVQTPITFTGTGRSTAALLRISPTTLTFQKIVAGDSASGADQSVIFENEGNSDLTITSIRYSETGFGGPFIDGTTTSNGTQVGVFTFQKLPSAIAANGASTVNVNFNPPVSGNYYLYVVVTSSGGTQNLTVVASSGPAPVALLEFQTPDGKRWVTYEQGVNFTFGNVTENTTRNLKLRLTNAGGEGAINLDVTVSKPPFGVPGIVAAVNQVDLAEGTVLGPGESATATLYCSVPKEQWNTDPYTGSAQWTMNTNDPGWDKQYMQFECTAVSEQASPLLGNGLGAYRYVGCFKENNPGRQLSVQLYGNDNNTNAMCIAACAEGGYAYCGTQYQRECWAGQTIPVEKVGEADCNYYCTGDVDQTCGGNGVGADAGLAFMSLFYHSGNGGSGTTPGDGTTPGTGGPTVVTNPGEDGYESIGCYSEGTGVRALANYFDTNKTVGACIDACAGVYAYIGLEYGGECWCGSDFGEGSVQVNLTDCSMPCTGNSSEYCGGSDRLNVYSGNVTAPTDPGTPSNPGVKDTITSSAGTVWTHIGCWTEANLSRALSDATYANDSMTLESCADFCDAYTYLGAEYGRECYCGNTIHDGSVEAAASDCSMACAGNGTEYCGGSDRLELYGKGGATPPSTSSAVSSSATSALVPGNTDVLSSTTGSAGGSVASSSLSAGASDSGSATPTSNTTPSSMSSVTPSTDSPSSASTSPTGLSSGTAILTATSTTPLASSSTSSATSSASSGVYTGPPVVSQGNENFTYYSCMSEPSDGRLLVTPGLIMDYANNMTIEYCLSTCWMRNYAGVEYGSECWCADALSLGGTAEGATAAANVSDSDCGFACPGNSSEYCGADNRLSVYANKVVLE